MEKPDIGSQCFKVETLDVLEGEMEEELRAADPLQVTLTVEKNEFGYLDKESRDYEKTLDLCAISDLETTQLQAFSADRVNDDLQKDKEEDPWSKFSAPKIELKQLPPGLRYAFLGPNSTYPVIINSELGNDETDLLLRELRKFRKTIGYSLDDIKGIS